MLRVVLAVAMATALLGVTMPALDTVRVQHGDERVEMEVQRLERAAERLASDNDPPPPGMEGPRQELQLWLPVAGLHTAGVESLTIQPEDTEHGEVNLTAGRTAVRWQVSGGPEQVRWLTDVELATRGKRLRLDDGGRQRLTLELRSDGAVLLTRGDV